MAIELSEHFQLPDPIRCTVNGCGVSLAASLWCYLALVVGLLSGSLTCLLVLLSAHKVAVFFSHKEDFCPPMNVSDWQIDSYLGMHLVQERVSGRLRGWTLCTFIGLSICVHFGNPLWASGVYVSLRFFLTMPGYDNYAEDIVAHSYSHMQCLIRNPADSE